MSFYLFIKLIHPSPNVHGHTVPFGMGDMSFHGSWLKLRYRRWPWSSLAREGIDPVTLAWITSDTSHLNQNPESHSDVGESHHPSMKRPPIALLHIIWWCWFLVLSWKRLIYRDVTNNFYTKYTVTLKH